MALEKGTEEWMFWSDFFQMCKEYWNVRDNEDYWNELSKAVSNLYEKYKTPYASRLGIAFIDAQNDRYQANNK